MLLAPGLLAAAQVMTLVGLISRVGSYPLQLVGLIAYTAVTLAAVGWLARPLSRAGRPGTTTLLALSTPALASFAFWLGLGGPYAPYDSHDSDLVRLSHLTFAILFAVIAVVYSSLSYLGVAATVHVMVHFITYALPFHVSYPASSLLEPQPSIFTVLCGVYLAGAILTRLRNRVVGYQTPSLWVASMLISLVSAFFLYAVLTWLPHNGAYVGYAHTSSYVPEDAWDWIRSAAESLVILAMAASVLSGLFALIGTRLNYRAKVVCD